MKKSLKNISRILLLMVIFTINKTIVLAQTDTFFYDNIESRDSDYIGYSSLSDDYIFSYSLFEENGFTFNGFGNGNDNNGFSFNDFDFAPDDAPLGNGLLLLSAAGLFYVKMKRRNRKEE